MSTIAIILKIRFKQFFRYLKEIGIIRVIILLLFLFITFNSLLKSLQNQIIAYSIVVVSLLSIISLHYQRKDSSFLKSICYNIKAIYFVEYALLLSPLFLLNIFSGLWIVVLVLFTSLVVVAFLPKKNKQESATPFEIPFISSISFEWKSGIRTYFPSLLAFYILSLGFIYVFWATPILLLFLSLVISFFYLECEPLLMLQVFNISPAKFMQEKLIQMGINFLTLLSPIILLYLIFNFAYWYLLLYSLVGGMSICTLAILLKYSMYEPLISLRLNNILLSMMLLAFLVPFLAGAAFIVIFRKYKKAISNLEYYLYGYQYKKSRY